MFIHITEEGGRECVRDCHPSVFTLGFFALKGALVELPGHKHDTEAKHLTRRVSSRPPEAPVRYL